MASNKKETSFLLPKSQDASPKSPGCAYLLRTPVASAWGSQLGSIRFHNGFYWLLVGVLQDFEDQNGSEVFRGSGFEAVALGVRNHSRVTLSRMSYIA